MRRALADACVLGAYRRAREMRTAFSGTCLPASSTVTNPYALRFVRCPGIVHKRCLTLAIRLFLSPSPTARQNPEILGKPFHGFTWDSGCD
jgi:hypothetical protein